MNIGNDTVTETTCDDFIVFDRNELNRCIKKSKRIYFFYLRKTGPIVFELFIMSRIVALKFGNHFRISLDKRLELFDNCGNNSLSNSIVVSIIEQIKIVCEQIAERLNSNIRAVM